MINPGSIFCLIIFVFVFFAAKIARFCKSDNWQYIFERSKQRKLFAAFWLDGTGPYPEEVKDSKDMLRYLKRKEYIASSTNLLLKNDTSQEVMQLKAYLDSGDIPYLQIIPAHRNVLMLFKAHEFATEDACVQLIELLMRSKIKWEGQEVSYRIRLANEPLTGSL